MLSRALQNAHTAVLLDNAQNFEGAIHAYAVACELLKQVLLRSSGEDDRRKLEAIVRSRTQSFITQISTDMYIAQYIRATNTRAAAAELEFANQR
jgi:hypothetical protein